MTSTTDPRDELDALTGHGPAQFTDAKRTMPRGARAFLLLSMVVAVVILLVVTWSVWAPDKRGNDSAQEITTRSGIANSLKLPEVKKPSAVVRPAEPDVPAPSQPRLPVIVSGQNTGLQVDDVAQRRLGSALHSDMSSSAQNSPDQQHDQTMQVSHGGDAGPLADKLRPLELQPSVAGQLGDRNFLLTQGSMIDCVMQSRLVTAQAGMVTCLATTDVMSANGKVVLIDAGTKFTGYQSGGIVQGQARAFITWNRLETPQGVIVNLGSPGTGPLGEAGVDGAINHHFWQRFGNAILLSLVGDLGNWASNQGNRGDNNIRFDNTNDGAQEIVAKVLEHSLDIPPTLYKNQGERIGIMVARDLDFSHVYALKPTD